MRPRKTSWRWPLAAGLMRRRSDRGFAPPYRWSNCEISCGSIQETEQPRRDALLKKIEANEGVTPKGIADLAAHMKPPLETEPQQSPGFYELSIGANNGDPAITYYVQLPPEYDPHFRYPCVVTLHGAGSTPQQQIDWWAGEQIRIKDAVVRAGQARDMGTLSLHRNGRNRIKEYTKAPLRSTMRYYPRCDMPAGGLRSIPIACS